MDRQALSLSEVGARPEHCGIADSRGEHPSVCSREIEDSRRPFPGTACQCLHWSERPNPREHPFQAPVGRPPINADRLVVGDDYVGQPMVAGMHRPHASPRHCGRPD